MMKRLVLLSLVGFVSFGALGVAQEEGFGDKVRALLQEATDLYKRGKHA